MTLILLVGPAGVGKTTIWEESILRNGYKPFKTYTTRQKREEDMTGIIQYNFIEQKEFEQKVSEGFFFEHEFYTKGFYGTSNADLKTAVDSDDIYIAIVDIRGALNIQKSFKVKTIFILPPSVEEMERRIVGRNSESLEEIKERVRIAVEEELPKKDLLDYSITNDTVENALRQFQSIVTSLKVAN